MVSVKPRPFYPYNQWTGGWADPTVSLISTKEKKILLLPANETKIPDTPTHSFVNNPI
jgi:hypothetical protein